MLPLPLHCYDESGRVKPPKWLYWFILLGCRDVFLVLMSVVFPEQTDVLLGLLYRDGVEMLEKIAFALPFIVALLLLSYHHALLSKQWVAWLRLFKPLLLLGFCLSLVDLVMLSAKSHGHFSAYVGVSILFNVMGVVCLFRSRHIRVMLRDWSRDAQ